MKEKSNLHAKEGVEELTSVKLAFPGDASSKILRFASSNLTLK